MPEIGARELFRRSSRNAREARRAFGERVLQFCADGTGKPLLQGLRHKVSGLLPLDSEHILHVEQTVASITQEATGTHRALGVGGATRSPVGNFHPFALAQEHHRMVTHQIATTHHRIADAFVAAGTSFTMPIKQRHRIVIATQSVRRESEAYSTRSTRRGLHSVAFSRGSSCRSTLVFVART